MEHSLLVAFLDGEISPEQLGRDAAEELAAITSSVAAGNLPARPPAGQGLYQIGELKARSCTVIGMLAGIFSLKNFAS